MSLLDVSHYDAVRAALDTSLTEEALPDTVIAMDIYAGAADLDVLARDPDAEGRTGAERVRVTNAAVYYCAARLAPSVPHLVAAQNDHVRWQRQEVDWLSRARELRQMADDSLSAVLESGVTVRPTVFAVASGRRVR